MWLTTAIMISALLSKFSVVTTYHQRSTSRIVSFTTRLISKAARSAANNKTPVVINEDDLEEKFVRGHGPGGQSINKTRNNVQLRHIPTGIFVECQEQRELSQNRKIARKVLKDKIDLAVNGANSKLGLRHAKKKRNKRKSASRAKKKYGVEDAEEMKDGHVSRIMRSAVGPLGDCILVEAVASSEGSTCGDGDTDDNDTVIQPDNIHPSSDSSTETSLVQ